MFTEVPALEHDFEVILGELEEEVGSFRILLAALEETGVSETLRRNRPFTLFAPPDEAFAHLEASHSQDWLGRTEPRRRAILDYHVLSGKMLANEIIESSTVRTIKGSGLTIRFASDRMYVNNALVLRADVACDGGVIHVLDTVLIPR